MRDRIIAGWRRPGIVNYLLYPLSLLYRVAVQVRAWCFRCGIFRSERLPVPVVVVGNITAGGSGKTPLVMEIVESLRANGYRPGVISRGYGGSSPEWPRIVDAATTAEMVGDEPQLIHQLTGLPVVVGPDRIESGKLLIDHYGCDVVVSDDGFQHLALDRDFDIVVVDGDFQFGNGWCLPAGPLREPGCSLERADIVVFNGPTEETVSTGRPQGAMHMDLVGARRLADGKELPLEAFSDQKVHAVAGIGNPERFFRQLETAGIDILRHPFPDHYKFRAQDLVFTDGHPVLMTEKDRIKCLEFDQADMWSVRTRVRIDPIVMERIQSALESG